MTAYARTFLAQNNITHSEKLSSDVLASYGALQAKLVQITDMIEQKFQKYTNAHIDDRIVNNLAIIVVDEDNDGEVVALCKIKRFDNRDQMHNKSISGRFSRFELPAISNQESFLELSDFQFIDEEHSHRLRGFLWQAVAHYCQAESIDYVVGSLMFNNRYPAACAVELSYLHHFYMAEPNLRAKAINGVTMDIMPEEAINPSHAFSSLPPMLRYCLRLGAKVGDGAVVDRQNNQIHIFLLLPAKALLETVS